MTSPRKRRPGQPSKYTPRDSASDRRIRDAMRDGPGSLNEDPLDVAGSRRHLGADELAARGEINIVTFLDE